MFNKTQKNNYIDKIVLISELSIYTLTLVPFLSRYFTHTALQPYMSQSFTHTPLHPYTPTCHSLTHVTSNYFGRVLNLFMSVLLQCYYCSVN